MAGTKISALTALTTVANGDIIPIVDVSDTTQGPNGSTKGVTGANLAAYAVSAALPFIVVTATGVAAADTTLLQTAYNNAPAGSTIVAKGVFTLLSQVTIPSNTVSDWNAASFLRGYNTTVPVAQVSKYTGSLFRQAGTSAENIKIEGGFVDSNGFTGPLLAFYGVDNLTLSDIDLDYTGAGDWCVTVGGTRINISNVNPRGGAAVFEDGIHIVKADGVTINGCHVESGDDMVALSTFDSDPVRHVTVTGITGTSQNGHLFRIDVQAASAVIEHVAFVAGAGIAGTSSNSGIRLANATADKQKMRHITISAATLLCGGTPSVNARGIHVDCGYDIIFNGVQVSAWPWEQLYLNNVDQVRVVGSAFVGAAGSTLPTARVLSSIAVAISNSLIATGASGTTSPIRHISTENLSLMNCDLVNVPNGQSAVYVDTGNTTLQIDGCRATLASGSAHGIRVNGALTRLIYGAGNDFEPLGGFEIYPGNLPSTMRVAHRIGTPTAVTLVSDTLDVPASGRPVQVEGQSGAADNLATIRLVSGLSGYTGQELTLFRGGEDITVKHGTGNIKTTTAADVVMTATANTVLHFAYDGTNWIQI